MAEAELATLAGSAVAAPAIPQAAEDPQAEATPVEVDSAAAAVVATAVAEEEVHLLAVAPQPEVVVGTTRLTPQRCATGCGPGLGMGRPVSTRVCSRVTRILHPRGSATPPHVLSRTEIHAT